VYKILIRLYYKHHEMAKILNIISSPRGVESETIKLATAIIEKLKANDPSAVVHEMDLTKDPYPHLGSAEIAAFFTPVEVRSSEQNKILILSDEAVSTLQNADIIVIGAPLYNFGIPSTLKSWIDHISRVGKTFRYSDQGAEGLVKGKKVYIAMSSGAVYSEGFYQPYDFVSPYLRTMLGFLGMTDLTIFRIEGVNIPGLKETALQKAIENINL
jgi:FMN-dependent NADH-azoreductase